MALRQVFFSIGKKGSTEEQKKPEAGLPRSIIPPPKEDLVKLSQFQAAFFDDSRGFLEEKKKAIDVANLILSAEDNEVKKAIAIVKENPDVLRRTILAIDPLGRQVYGTPLEIAAMAKDVNLKAGITDEKDLGMVERLIRASNLSPEEVKKQLECVTSSAAIEATEKRKQKILDVVIQFGEAVKAEFKAEHKDDSPDCCVLSDMESDNPEIERKRSASVESAPSLEEKVPVYFKQRIEPLTKDYRALFTSFIEQLTVEAFTKDVITQGYIFPPEILHIAGQWFADNVEGFGNSSSNEGRFFFKTMMGMLQKLLTRRYAQILQAGVENSEETRIVPSRTVKNVDGSSYFAKDNSCLGKDFSLGTRKGKWQSDFGWDNDSWETVCKSVVSWSEIVSYNNALRRP